MLKGIDLFCGCGGISAGLRDSGVSILAGVDVEPKYLCTFTRNFPESVTLCQDLSTFEPKRLADRLGLARGELDILAGGPPCQGFSKNIPRKNRAQESDNNLLVRTFLDYCETLHPKMILMENVAEMRNGFDQTYTTEIQQRLERLGYDVAHSVLNAADYGVPQLRRRAFFIASRIGATLEFPPQTHYPQGLQLNLLDQPRHVPVWEAIGDLPPLRHGEGESECEYAGRPFSEYQRLMRNGAWSVKNHVARKLQPTQHARLAALLPGQGLKDLPKELQVKGGYSGAYGRLTKEMVCRTITRWVFHPGSGRWGHPVDVRTLSIREVARIQGFPDSYEFEGSYTEQAGQLGNAAPPLLIKQIAATMFTRIDATLLPETSAASRCLSFPASAAS